MRDKIVSEEVFPSILMEEQAEIMTEIYDTLKNVSETLNLNKK
jgi:hypothetical protein